MKPLERSRNTPSYTKIGYYLHNACMCASSCWPPNKCTSFPNTKDLSWTSWWLSGTPGYKSIQIIVSSNLHKSNKGFSSWCERSHPTNSEPLCQCGKDMFSLLLVHIEADFVRPLLWFHLPIHNMCKAIHRHSIGFPHLNLMRNFVNLLSQRVVDWVARNKASNTKKAKITMTLIPPVNSQPCVDNHRNSRHSNWCLHLGYE